MPRQSLDSERPIMSPSVGCSSLLALRPLIYVFAHPDTTLSQLASKRTSVRMSTYSASPSFATNPNLASSSTDLSSTGRAEISHITSGLDRLENKKLAEQRFVPSPQKSENLDKLALGAKVERALGRRMVGQDAVMRRPKEVVKRGKSTPIIIESVKAKMEWPKGRVQRRCSNDNGLYRGLWTEEVQ